MEQPALKPHLQAFYLGPVPIDPPLFLAPMAGHTHVGFRTLVRELGSCGLVCSELISSHVLSHHPQSRKTMDLFDWSDKEWPFAVQLFGACPQEMAESARIVAGAGAPIIDINMGCWVPKVAKKGCGAALLKDLNQAEAVVKAVCDAVDVPVTVKIRIGFTEGEPTALPFALAAAEAGVKLITVHGRYAKQGFKGQSDHSVTRSVKEALGDAVKVVANGDIVDLESALAVLELTHCDGLMLGRECLRRPWILAELAEQLCGRVSQAQLRDPVGIAQRHLELSEELVKKPEKVLVRELRGQLLPYRLGAARDHNEDSRSELEQKLREGLIRTESFQDLHDFLESARECTRDLYG